MLFTKKIILSSWFSSDFRRKFMDKQISSGLKNLFRLHFIAGVLFGLIYLFAAEMYGQLINWPVLDAAAFKLIGAALVAFGCSSGLALKNPLWERVEILVLTEVIWTGLAALVMIWGIFFAGLPAIAWMNTALMLFFALGFGFFYFKEK